MATLAQSDDDLVAPSAPPRTSSVSNPMRAAIEATLAMDDETIGELVIARASSSVDAAAKGSSSVDASARSSSLASAAQEIARASSAASSFAAMHRRPLYHRAGRREGKRQVQRTNCRAPTCRAPDQLPKPRVAEPAPA